MKPTQPQEIYKITAKRLNLSDEYVKDAVEFFYQKNKDGMGSISYTIFNLMGLGRFLIRPFKFFNKKKRVEKLVDKFKDRRDDRGIMIRNELQKRLQQFENAQSLVEDFNTYLRKRMFKAERNEIK